MLKSRHAINSILILSFVTFAFSFVVSAQDRPENPQPSMISAGIVNGKAKTLPKPEYPPEAARDRASGTVNVDVVIDETGRVISAEATRGVEHPALRAAARAAAMKAEFSPTTLQGVPVKVKGTIAYNFAFEKEPLEEKLKYMGFAMILTVAKSFGNDLEKFNTAFEGSDLLSEMPLELPQFATELKAVSALSTVPAAKRKSVIDEAIAAVESKVDAPTKWQIAAGREFGGLMGPLMYKMSSGEPPDAMPQYEAEVLKGHLVRLAALIEKAPSDVPEVVVNRLSELASLHARQDLHSRGNVVELAKRILAVTEAISP